MEIEEIDITTPLVNIAAQVFNPKAKKKVLAVHGWLDNSNSFKNIASHLPHYQIIAVDLPGHGKSEHYSPGKLYHFLDYVTILLDVIIALDLEQDIHVLAHSLGAGITTFLPNFLGRRISKLALIDGIGPFANRDDEAAATFKKYYKHHLRLANRKKTTLRQC